MIAKISTQNLAAPAVDATSGDSGNLDSGLTAPKQAGESPFGPDYIVDTNKTASPPRPAGVVPFSSAGSTADLAALPPLAPMGAASLTELSLNQLLQAPRPALGR